MNLDHTCARCTRPRREHSGTTYQGRCPEDAAYLLRNALRGRPPLPYRMRIWKGVPGLADNGNGPWMILADCPAYFGHNTVNAAEARRRGPACVCPHALDLRKKRKAQRSKRGVVTPRKHTPTLVAAPITIPQPDLSAGLCTSPVGASIIDATFDSKYAFGRAVVMCQKCPLRDSCEEYVLTAESPPGAWGGVWGGLTPADRRKRAKA